MYTVGVVEGEVLDNCYSSADSMGLSRSEDDTQGESVAHCNCLHAAGYEIDLRVVPLQGWYSLTAEFHC